MIVSTDRRMTLDQYLTYTHDTDVPYELVDGVVTEMAPENPENNTIALIVLAQFLFMGIPVQRLATAHQVQVQSAYVSARQPDLMVHSEASRKAIKTEGLLTLDAPPPLLVVEVVSSSDTDRKSKKRDYIDKRAEYQARGIPEYWIIDPIAGLVMVLSLVDGAYVEATYRDDESIVSPTVAGLSLTAEQVLGRG